MTQVEKVRSYLDMCDAKEVFEFLEKAIEVAAAEHPKELEIRRKRLMDMLSDTNNLSTFEQPSKASPTPEPRYGKLIIRIKKNGRGVVVSGHKDEPKKPCIVVSDNKDEPKKRLEDIPAAQLQWKLEAAKRKIHETQRKIDEAKKQREIKLIDLQDVPAAQLKKMTKRSRR